MQSFQTKRKSQQYLRKQGILNYLLKEVEIFFYLNIDWIYKAKCNLGYI